MDQIWFVLFQSVLLLEGATDKFTGDEACRIYLQAAIVYERVRLKSKWFWLGVFAQLFRDFMDIPYKSCSPGLWLSDPGFEIMLKIQSYFVHNFRAYLICQSCTISIIKSCKNVLFEKHSFSYWKLLIKAMVNLFQRFFNIKFLQLSLGLRLEIVLG